MARAAVFLDRDDTINRNADLPSEAWDGVKKGDLLKPEFAILVPGAREAIVALRSAGYAIVVITNQGGLARGGGTTRDVEAVNDELRSLVNGTEPGVDPVFGKQLIDGFYFAPHHPGGVVTHYCDDHGWRKPNGGMIRAACAELDLDPERSWMIGDKLRDIEAGMDAGIARSRSILIDPKGDAPDLARAAEMVLGSIPGGKSVEVDDPKVSPASRVTLRAVDPGFVPMRDSRTREMVEVIARGISERTGIVLHELDVDEERVEALIGTHRLAALAFMAELRRDTNRWHERQYGTPLWDLTERM